MKLVVKILIFFFITHFFLSCNNNFKNDHKISSTKIDKQSWMKKPLKEWPQITMINHINYFDRDYSIAGCGFLLDIGKDTIAATVKHILTYFNSNNMRTVSFNNSLRYWEMYPKNNKNDKVYIGEIINENPHESLQGIPVNNDWLLLSVKQKSLNIQPLQFRKTSLSSGEKVYIIGWRYCDTNCTQRIYEGNFVRYLGGSLIISTKLLKNNTVPGLSGSPVIDSVGYLIGIMSQKYGEEERLSSTEYPIELLSNKNKIIK